MGFQAGALRAQSAIAEREKAHRAGSMVDSPRWDEARDAMVLDTGGRYRACAALAAHLGLTSVVVLARWHVVRGR